jgi:hypothetical protein
VTKEAKKMGRKEEGKYSKKKWYRNWVNRFT